MKQVSRNPFAAQQDSWGEGEIWEEEIPRRGGEGLPERELAVSKSHEVDLIFGKRTVSLSDPKGVPSLPRTAGIYFIYINGNIWYVGKATSIRERFQERMKVFKDFKIQPSQYLPLLQPVTVRWYELGRFTDPPGSSFKTRGSAAGSKWVKRSTRLGLLIALEQHFIFKYQTHLLGNKTTECIRTEGVITIVYDFGASRKPREKMPKVIFAEKCGK